MRHLFILLLSFLLCPFVDVYGQTEDESVTTGDSFLFSFIPGEADIQATYGNNAIEIERMSRKVWPAIDPLLDGEFHILIVSHIYSETGSVSKTAVNTAMWRGNSVRRYLKNKYDLENNQISYYVDRSGEWGNSVHVYLLYYPMPEFANRQIFYSTDQSIKGITTSLRRYAEVPYIYVMNDPDLCAEGETFAYVVVDNKAELPYQAGAMKAVLPPVHKVSAEETVVESVQAERTERPAQKTVPVVASAPVAETRKAVEPKQEPRATKTATQEPVETQKQVVLSEPVKKLRPKYQLTNMTVRTNLLPWATVSPSLGVGKNGAEMKTGSIMPNIELEYMFGGWGSVVVGGLYSRFGYKGNPNNLWGVSEVSVEPRLWFVDDGSYRGFNVGIRLQYGNFNVRDNDPIGHGETGQFFSVGAMLNYYQAIAGNFGMEAGVGFGSRMVFDGSTYHRDYDTQVSETVEKFSMTHFMVNFRIALVYRFGFK